MQSLAQTLYRLRVRLSQTATMRDQATGAWRAELDRELIAISKQIRQLEEKENDIKYKPEVETR